MFFRSVWSRMIQNVQDPKLNCTDWMSHLGTFRIGIAQEGGLEGLKGLKGLNFLVNCGYCGHLGCLGDFIGREAATDPGDKSSTTADWRMFNTLWNTFCPKFYHKFKFDMLKCAEMIWNAFKVSRIVLSGMPGVQISLAGGAAGVDQPLEWYIHPCILWWLYTCRTLPEATTEEVIYDICDFFFAIFAAVQFVCALPQLRDLSGANCGVSKFIQNWARVVNRLGHWSIFVCLFFLLLSRSSFEDIFY